MMGLTRRQLEFLEKIVTIYRETNIPVHYANIGKEMGVSKWTAYDLMKRLQKEGYLRSEYTLNTDSKNIGRSLIVFYPTEKAFKKVEESNLEAERSSAFKELVKTREYLMKFFNNSKGNDHKKAKKEILHELSQIEVPVVFGVYVIALFIAIIYSESLLIDHSVATKMLQSGLAPELILSFFAGMSIGTAKNGVKGTLDEAVMPYIVQFQNYMSHYDRREKEFLVDFLRDVLNKHE